MRAAWSNWQADFVGIARQLRRSPAGPAAGAVPSRHIAQSLSVGFFLQEDSTKPLSGEIIKEKLIDVTTISIYNMSMGYEWDEHKRQANVKK